MKERTVIILAFGLITLAISGLMTVEHQLDNINKSILINSKDIMEAYYAINTNQKYGDMLYKNIKVNRKDISTLNGNVKMNREDITKLYKAVDINQKWILKEQLKRLKEQSKRLEEQTPSIVSTNYPFWFDLQYFTTNQNIILCENYLVTTNHIQTIVDGYTNTIETGSWEVIETYNGEKK